MTSDPVSRSNTKARRDRSGLRWNLELGFLLASILSLLVLADILVIWVSFDLRHKNEAMTLESVRDLKSWNVLQSRLGRIGATEVQVLKARSETDRQSALKGNGLAVLSFRQALDEFEDRVGDPRLNPDFDAVEASLDRYQKAIVTAWKEPGRFEALGAFADINQKLALISERTSVQFEEKIIRQGKLDRTILRGTNTVALAAIVFAVLLFVLYRPRSHKTEQGQRA